MFLFTMSKEKEIFDYLYEVGCCKCCCLRYVCLRSPDIYIKADSYVLMKKLLPEVTEECTEEQVAKKHKANPCIVCLGLLQSFCIDEVVENVAQNELVKSYDSDVFTCSVSFPASLQIREHSIRIYLEKKFPDYFTEDIMETQINKVWKWIIKDKIADKLNKSFETSETCPFSINISMDYELDEEELSVLLKMQPLMFSTRKTQHRKYHGEVFSRKGVLTALEQTRTGVFLEHSSVPPTVSSKWLRLQAIQCNHDSIYLGGRYCKYSRELSQTPWILNGKRLMESSVQDIIFEAISKILQISDTQLVFSASGREDVDVRCLGKGRPFYAEIQNPKRTKFTFAEMRDVETEINSSKLLMVRDLQLVPRSELVHIKSGEESKTKEYLALCRIETGVTADIIQKINEHGPVELKQKTPIRVLHRRPLAVRLRTVHSMSATALEGEDKFFTLKLTTQAGTYVKEFVHSDFGRTVPSMCTIVGVPVDIFALDVTSVNLDWPSKIVYENK